MSLHPQIAKAFKNNQALKVITGINNFDLKDIILKAQAAEIGGATYIDIAANVDILQEVKRIVSIPICVSSIDVNELYQCFQAGADVLEIGNFDIFYKHGIYFNSKQVENLTIELFNKVPNANVCVTIPHHLPIAEQILLAQKLEVLGVAIIQTEGISSQRSSNNYLFNSIYNASSALSSTYVFSRNINIPILSASGIRPLTAPIALAYGASGVGIGSFFNSSKTMFDLTTDINSVSESIYRHGHVNTKVSNLLLSYSEHFSIESRIQNKLKANLNNIEM